MMLIARTMVLASVLALGGCGDDDAGDAGRDAASPDATDMRDVGTDAAPDVMANECTRGALAEDFDSSPWLGPGADAETGELTATDATLVVATTYALIDPDAQEAFDAQVAAVTGQIMMSPGLHAVRFGSSSECGVGRTITLWTSLEAMTDFAFSGAHLEALRSSSALTLPGSATTNYMGAEMADFEWARATTELAGVDPYGE